MTKTKKAKQAGKFGARYGATVKRNYNAIDSLQRQKQICPHCNKPAAKRIAAGIWHCGKCGKTFAGPAYSLNVAK